jgi:hypothetical protein
MDEVLKIRDRNGKIVKLTLNYPQRVFHNILEKQREEFGYVRAIVCKARRLGFSTYTEARFYHFASIKPASNVYIVSHRDDSCDVLFTMAKLFQERNWLKPTTKRSNKKQILFTHKSEYSLASAHEVAAAKSRDITLFHGSEVAEWRAADDLLNALLPCLPDPPVYSEAVLESTARGYGNLFQRWCFKAYAEGAHPYYTQDGNVFAWKHPDFEWLLCFFAWWQHPEYLRPFDTQEMADRFKADVNRPVFKTDLGVQGDSYEKELMNRYGLSWEQIHWYVHTKRNKHNDDFDDMREQHPSELLEAFVTTGSNVFSVDICNKLEEECIPWVVEGELVERAGKPRLNRMKNGRLKIWESAQPDGQYLVTIDPAGGKKELQEDKNDPDFTCMDVWKRTDKYLVQVAQWHGHEDFDLIADIAALLGRMYNRADFAVLRMNHGLTVIAGLRKAHGAKLVRDDDRQDGLNEDRKRKPIMVDSLKEDCREGYIILRNKESVQELRTYIMRDGKYGAEDGAKDDRVSSAYAAAYAVKDMPIPRDSKRRGYVRPHDTVVFKNWSRHVNSKVKKDNSFTVEVP